MSNARQTSEREARADRGERLTAAGVIAAYVHEISGRHRDERIAAEPGLGTQPAE